MLDPIVTADPPAIPQPGSDASELDLRGLRCPLPVLRTRKALAMLAPGGSLRVFCTDPLAGLDIPHLVREMGHVLVAQARDDGVQSFTIRKA